MFKITKTGDHFSHRCVQCGLIIQYNVYTTVEKCVNCDGLQRLRTISENNSAPVHFMMDGIPLWRLIYHLRDTVPK